MRIGFEEKAERPTRPRPASRAPVREPRRRCLVTRAVLPRGDLLRFVVGPEGEIVPDLEGRLPGRGLWLRPQRDIVAAAAAKNLFAKAARRPVSVPADLPARVEALAARRCRELLGLARRSGQVVVGFHQARALLAKGRAGLVLMASDEAAQRRRKLEGPAGGPPLSVALTGSELAAAFAREHVACVAVAPGRLAQELDQAVRRLAALRGLAGMDRMDDER